MGVPEFSELIIDRLMFAEDEWIQIATSIGPKNEKWTDYRFPRDKAIRVIDKAIEAGKELNIFFGANPVVEGTGRAGSKEVTRFSSFYLDLDLQPNKLGSLRNAARVIQYFSSVSEWVPGAVVHTGGGLHAYWTLEPEFGVLHEHKYNCKRALVGVQVWANEYGLGSIDTVVDPARLLRVPGSKNFKYDPAPTAYLVGALLEDSEGELSCLTLSQSQALVARLSVQEEQH
jgi:hypothetical protein